MGPNKWRWAPPQLHRYCQWGHSVGHAVVHVHPTRYMMHVYVQYKVCVCGGGGTIHSLSTPQQLMVRVKGRRMQVYVYVCAYNTNKWGLT